MGTWIKPTSGVTIDDATIKVNSENQMYVNLDDSTLGCDSTIAVKDGGITTGKIAADSLATSATSGAENSKLTTKGYVDDFLPLSGGTMQGAISMNGKWLMDLPTPTAAGHATDKNYVDGLTGKLSDLKTSAQTSLVDAVNELHDGYQPIAKLVESPSSLADLFLKAFGVSTLASIPQNSFMDCYATGVASSLLPTGETEGYFKLLFKNSSYMQIQFQPYFLSTIYTNKYYAGAWSGWQGAGIYYLTWSGTSTDYLLNASGSSVSAATLYSLYTAHVPVYVFYNGYPYAMTYATTSNTVFRVIGGSYNDEGIMSLNYTPSATTKVTARTYWIEDLITTLNSSVSSISTRLSSDVSRTSMNGSSSFYQKKNGIVCLSLSNAQVSSSGATFFTLPSGCRPGFWVNIALSESNGSAAVNARVNTSGAIVIWSTAQVSGSCAFVAES